MAPMRLRSRNSQSSSAMAKPKPIRNKRYAENTAGADLHGSLQRLRHRKPLHGSAPDRLHQIQEDEGESERQQHLVHVTAAIERPHEYALDHDAGRDHRDGRKDERQPEAAGRAKDRQAQVAPRA